MSIVIKNISKVYGTQKALDNVSLSIGEGEIVGLLGPNGAGKSTMMKILTCFIPPTEGSAEICGYDIFEHQNGICDYAIHRSCTQVGDIPILLTYGHSSSIGFLATITDWHRSRQHCEWPSLDMDYRVDHRWQEGCSQRSFRY